MTADRPDFEEAANGKARLGGRWSRLEFAWKRRIVEAAVVVVAGAVGLTALAIGRLEAARNLGSGVAIILVVEAFWSMPSFRTSDRLRDLQSAREAAGNVVLGLFWLLGIAAIIVGASQLIGGR